MLWHGPEYGAGHEQNMPCHVMAMISHHRFSSGPRPQTPGSTSHHITPHAIPISHPNPHISYHVLSFPYALSLMACAYPLSHPSHTGNPRFGSSSPFIPRNVLRIRRTDTTPGGWRRGEEQAYESTNVKKKCVRWRGRRRQELKKGGEERSRYIGH